MTWLANEITRRMELFVLEPSDVDPGGRRSAIRSSPRLSLTRERRPSGRLSNGERRARLARENVALLTSRNLRDR